ncbi:hypothetical protein DL767_010179 [Monosporascus sp. MG133]|nr:hypothetical protein DL767_010179 [Monosporascus sp. MG133]
MNIKINFSITWEIGRPPKTLRTRGLYDAHQKKGPIIRIALDWLSFGTAAAVKDIHGHKSPLVKNEVYFALQTEGQNLANITNKMDEMCTAPLPKGQLPAKQDLKFDGSLWGLLFGFEGVGMIGLSAKLGFIEQGSDVFELRKPDGSKQKINAIQSLHIYYGPVAPLIWDTKAFGVLRVLTGAFSEWYAKGWEHGIEWRQFLTQSVKDRTTRFDAGEYLEDLFQPMLEDRRTGDRPDISETDKIAEMDQMLNGAVDGTGSSVVNTLYYIIKHPKAYKRVRAEIDEALSVEMRVKVLLQVQ